MRNVTRIGTLSVLLFLAIGQEPAYAYIDPGSASYAFQIVVGGLLGGLFLVKTYWGKLKTFVHHGLSHVRRPRA